MKIRTLITSLFIIFIIFYFDNSAFASTKFQSESNEAITRVGNPIVSNPSQNGISANAHQIVQSLRPGFDPGLGVNLYNVKIDEPGVYYWCTYLIIDSYNRAGFRELTRLSHAAVVTMKNFFLNTGGKYRLLPANIPVEQLREGDVIFFEGNGQHVSLIKKININQIGDGVINTYESNNVSTEDVVFVVNHVATKAQTTSKRYSITGFGRVN